MFFFHLILHYWGIIPIKTVLKLEGSPQDYVPFEQYTPRILRDISIRSLHSHILPSAMTGYTLNRNISEAWLAAATMTYAEEGTNTPKDSNQ